MAVNALLGFQNKTAPFVKVNPARAAPGVAMQPGDGPLEDIGVLPVVRCRRVRRRNLQQGAQFNEEGLVVRQFLAAGGLPAGDEGGGDCVGSLSVIHVAAVDITSRPCKCPFRATSYNDFRIGAMKFNSLQRCCPSYLSRHE